ncbi:MAG TPA: hypothetical protein VG944_21790 [Fimbriimonas sp.]|nr:hypothetical protein [Fimbriimonas sp.]
MFVALAILALSGQPDSYRVSFPGIGVVQLIAVSDARQKEFWHPNGKPYPSANGRFGFGLHARNKQLLIFQVDIHNKQSPRSYYPEIVLNNDGNALVDPDLNGNRWIAERTFSATQAGGVCDVTARVAIQNWKIMATCRYLHGKRIKGVALGNLTNLGNIYKLKEPPPPSVLVECLAQPDPMVSYSCEALDAKGQRLRGAGSMTPPGGHTSYCFRGKVDQVREVRLLERRAKMVTFKDVHLQPNP